MTEAENFVRKHWGQGLEADSTSESVFFHLGDVGINFGSWEDAAQFTHERLEQIRQLAAEVGFVSGMVHHARQIVENSIGYPPYEPFLVGQTIDLVRWSRTLVRLRDALNELKRGMKL